MSRIPSRTIDPESALVSRFGNKVPDLWNYFDTNKTFLSMS